MPRMKRTARWRCLGYRGVKSTHGSMTVTEEKWYYECPVCGGPVLVGLKEAPPDVCCVCKTRMRWPMPKTIAVE